MSIPNVQVITHACSRDVLDLHMYPLTKDKYTYIVPEAVVNTNQIHHIPTYDTMNLYSY